MYANNLKYLQWLINCGLVLSIVLNSEMCYFCVLDLKVWIFINICTVSIFGWFIATCVGLGFV